MAQALTIIQSEYPTVTHFEREFPSLCFALATGVGKTRLMGAFITHLHAEMEQIKLEDGVRLHENTKVELETYALQTGQPLVKPFMLVIARDTTHAAQLLALIESEGFFNGRYAGKVIQVDSTTKEVPIVCRPYALMKRSIWLPNLWDVVARICSDNSRSGAKAQSFFFSSRLGGSAR